MKKPTSKSEPASEPARGRGRPRTNPFSIHLTLVPDQLARLDAWIADQKDEVLTHAEAVRRVLDKALLQVKGVRGKR